MQLCMFPLMLVAAELLVATSLAQPVVVHFRLVECSISRAIIIDGAAGDGAITEALKNEGFRGSITRQFVGVYGDGYHSEQEINEILREKPKKVLVKDSGSGGPEFEVNEGEDILKKLGRDNDQVAQRFLKVSTPIKQITQVGFIDEPYELFVEF